MTFLSPSMLLTLLVVPPIVLIYLLLQKRRAALASTYFRMSSGTIAKKASPGIRRHLPPLFFLLSLIVILVALARPQAQISLPRVEGTVILVVDVSASMRAEDVQPNRLEAAKAAAREFVLSQPETVQVGIVSFSASGFIVQTPTNDANTLLSTIDRLEPATGTSLGQGIVAALNAIAVDAGMMPEEVIAAAEPAAEGLFQPELDVPRSREAELLAKLPEGEYPASVIVLLTDGENTERFDPLTAAQAAADHEVRVNAVGFGTPTGFVLEVEGFNVLTALDEIALRQITEVAGGNYYAAQGGQDLREVYASLTPELVVKPENMEITSVFAGAAILMLLAGSLISMLWFTRLP